MRILFAPYDDQWRKMRKAMHYQLQPAQSKTFEPLQVKSAITLLQDILKAPDHFQEHISSYAATIVVNMAYGRQDKATYKDPDVAKIIQVSLRIGKILRPGAYLVESLPFLRYIPGYLKEPKIWHKEELQLFRDALNDTHRRMRINEADPCFASWITEKQQELDLSDDEVAYLCGSIFAAGSDTSSSAITVVVMAAATHTAQQKMVQEELDAVIGKGKTPQFSDWDDLPVTKAFCRESYRWRPVSAGGFAHKSLTELEYGGYRIPKGTTIIGNHWAVNRDPEAYPDPESFNIQRWLSKDASGRYSLNEKMPQPMQFGYGRRVCQGECNSPLE